MLHFYLVVLMVFAPIMPRGGAVGGGADVGPPKDRNSP